MKKQIRRVSPHQNGKVLGILMAISSLVFVIPMFIIVLFVTPAVDQHGNPVTFPKFMLFLFPVMYLVLGYLMTAIGSVIYNFLFRFIGGFEYEVKAENAEQVAAPDAQAPR
jgi:ABC-type Na+ efflux pump permease subunit